MTDEEVATNLLAMVNQTNFAGTNAEQIVEIKKWLIELAEGTRTTIASSMNKAADIKISE